MKQQDTIKDGTPSKCKCDEPELSIFATYPAPIHCVKCKKDMGTMGEHMLIERQLTPEWGAVWS